MEIFKQIEARVSPWKNGGGVTREMLRVPAGGESFDWRVSVAEIATSGKFSDFSGYHRTLVLLRGHGVSLDFPATETTLRRVGDSVQFDGALAVDSRLLQGSCVDLNLIVSHAKYMVSARVQRFEHSRAIQVPAANGAAQIIFSIRGALSLAQGRSMARLNEWDLALCTEDAPIEVAAIETASAVAAESMAFIATLKERESA